MPSARTLEMVMAAPSARGVGPLIQSRKTMSPTLRSGWKVTVSLPVRWRRSDDIPNDSRTTGRLVSGGRYRVGHALTGPGVDADADGAGAGVGAGAAGGVVAGGAAG